MTDSVNNPSHYASGAIECIDAMESMLSRDEFIGYLRGNIFKYQWRYKHKNGLEDLKKAEWYQRKLIEVEGRVSAPKAILEAEKNLCHHHWVDGLDGGTMVCAHKCGAWK